MSHLNQVFLEANMHVIGGVWELQTNAARDVK